MYHALGNPADWPSPVEETAIHENKICTVILIQYKLLSSGVAVNSFPGIFVIIASQFFIMFYIICKVHRYLQMKNTVQD